MSFARCLDLAKPIITSLALFAMLSIAFVNFDTTTSPPTVSEPDWQQALASTRFSPAVATESNSILLNDVPGKTVALGKTRIVINSPPAPDKTWTVTPPPSGSTADGLFEEPLRQIKSWQTTNPGKTARLLIKGGTYKFTDPRKYPMEISDFERLIVRGDVVGEVRPKFLIANLQRGSIRILNSSLVSFSGIEIEYDLGGTYGSHIAYRGKIVAKNTIEAPDLPADLASTIMSVRSFDPKSNVWFDRTGQVRPIHTAVHELVDLLEMKEPKRFESDDLSEFQIGENVLLMKTRRGYGGGFFVGGERSSDITIHGLVIRNYPQMAIRIENAGRGFHVIANRIIPKPGEILSGRADAIHVVGTLGDIVIEKNYVLGNGDDGINIRGTDVDVLSIEKTADSKLRVEIGTEYAGYLVGGDRVALYANGSPLAFAKSRAISSSLFELTPESNCESSCLDSLVSKMRQALVGERASLFNLTRTSSRFLIQKNRFSKNGGRGVVVQAPNGTVKDNLFYYPANPAILARLSDGGPISEGPGPVNVLIEGNRIRGANHGYNPRIKALNASIVLTNSGRTQDSFRFAQRMIVRNNCIADSGFGALSINLTRAVEVSDNVIGTFNQAPLPSGEVSGEAVTVSSSIALFKYPDVDQASAVCIAEEPPL